MEHNTKVFTSDIIRSNITLNNDLNELLEVVPAKSLPINIEHTSTCDFTPNTDKYYVPKKKSKLKVKTVRNIRELFEKEVYSDLHIELEKHRNALLRKIRIGSSREEATKKMAKVIFRSDSPVSKDIWQMLTHLNPDSHPYSAQFVLWNRRTIQINGSKGGKNKFICNFDIGKDNIRNLSKPALKLNKVYQKKTMLHKSIHVKFKPGPLSKKKYLDCSYQKFHYGNSTVVNLPKPGLDIQPTYGMPLGPTMTNFLNDNYMRNSNGEITEKWADFSLSVLGVYKKGCPLQIDKDACISFDMQYKCNQHRILMRNAIDNNDNIFNKNELTPLSNNQTNTISEVNIVMNKILDYVEIKLELDNQNSKEDDLIHAFSESDEKSNGILKEKGKRKFGELDRLDVTVIRLSSAESENAKCEKVHCLLGCICSSLECSYNLKHHCGRMECMFECKCVQWFTKSSDNSLHLSGLDDLNKTLNLGLAKEEQKFRQTVVFSGDKSILLKPQRRDWKSSKKYAEFYSNMCLKTETKSKKVLFVFTPKLNCDNIEPWCMVHNLYKCFCKGKFTERALPVLQENEILENIKEINVSAEVVPDKNTEPLKGRLRRRSHIQSTDTIAVEQDNVIKQVFNENDNFNKETMRCARLKPYKGRKYTDDYYSETNRKIIEMEKNDRSLMKKMISLINVGDEKENDRQSNAITPKDSPKRLPNRRKLVAWLEASYKHYKECKDQGLVMTSLEPPNESKLAFHSWEFILSRYRERKNLFLVTPEKPYRIFMAVKKEHPKLEACVNIKDIMLSDIQEYPATVKNLLTNSTELKDNFCILRGLAYCWELVGTVTKVNEIRGETINGEHEILNFRKESMNNCNTFFDEESQDDCRIETVQIDVESIQEKKSNLNSETNENDNKNEISKWFVMTVENDFDEIHFYKKGFFVKYDSVIKAINVSRVSNKTVRLSSQKCNNRQNNPQFGIYAIPNETDFNVFIGPYENDESLGIETVKTTLSRENTRQTRGSWIKINKIDNIKIIDQPLAFLPSTILSQEMLPIDGEISCVNETKTDHDSSQTEIKHKSIPDIHNEERRITKTVKPIKIRKSNGFYQLWPKMASPSQSLATLEQNKIYPTISQFSVVPAINLNNSIKIIGSNESDRKSSKPVAEIAPQIKVTEPTENKKPNTFERGMCILKPEEINKRSLLNQKPAGSSIIETIHDDIDRDIENFLATSTVCKLPDEDIFVISDEEIDEQCTISNVWIQSSNIPYLGWIPAKRNSSNHISFEFPGFKYTNFYTEEEAFRKINLVFSRKVYVPKNFDFKWEIVENEKYLKTKKKLVSNELGPNFVLTNKGLRPRFNVIQKQMATENANADAKIIEFDSPIDVFGKTPALRQWDVNSKRTVIPTTCYDNEKKKRKLLMELEDYTSSALENDNKKLCIEAVSKKSDIMQTISQANNNLRQEMAQRLSVLLSDSKSQTAKL